MNYPAFKQRVTSKPSSMDGGKIDRAADGSLRVRWTWDKRRRVFSVEHILTLEQFQELLSFYDLHRGADAEFDFEWRGEGQTYRCIFDGPPLDGSPIMTVNGKRYPVTCKLMEV